MLDVENCSSNQLKDSKVCLNCVIYHLDLILYGVLTLIIVFIFVYFYNGIGSDGKGLFNFVPFTRK